MKPLLILLQILLPLLIFSQKIWVDTDYHENGNLHWKGNMLEIDNSSSPIGFWEYWYEDGSKQLETWEDSSSKSFYLNMWLPSGEQILKNGQGVLFEKWPLGGNEWDSSVYQIKDSIKQGYYKGYRLYPKHKYFQVYQGQYDSNSKKTGEWTFKDSVVYKHWSVEYYMNDKLNGKSQHNYLNRILKDSGQNKDDLQDGEWREYHPNGNLLKVCNYEKGNLIGVYQEYHTNKKIKVQGQYIQDIKYPDPEKKSKTSSVSRKSNIRKSTRRATKRSATIILNYPYKDGVWQYFDTKGKLISLITYRKGRRV
jgi:antitoxin component YwqK of YwqJK toxin-antitoxin module